MHIPDGAGQEDRVGVAVACAAIDQGPASSRLGDTGGEIAPHRTTPQPLMEKHEGGGLLGRGTVPQVFELIIASAQVHTGPSLGAYRSLHCSLQRLVCVDNGTSVR